jgi:hypothetical protein
MSGQTAAKCCELRIATAAIPCLRPFCTAVAHFSARLAGAKPFAASVATSPGTASVTTGTARASLDDLSHAKDLGLDQSSRILVLVTERALGD